MGKRLNLANIIVQLQKNGMPVQFLRYVDKHMETEFGDSDEVSWFLGWKTLKLSPSTIRPLKKISPSLPLDEGVPIQTLYHEATHAYFLLRKKDQSVKTLMASGKQYYDGAPLKRGETADDPWQLFHEAAATYVGHRATSWWSTFTMIVTYIEMIEGNAKKPMSAKGWAADRTMHEIGFLVQKVRNMPKNYNKEMRVRTFGYEYEWEWKGLRRIQTETTKRMPNQLKKFCDTVILEDKIPDDFFHAGILVKRYNVLLKLVAPLNLPPRSVRGRGRIPDPQRR